MASNYEIHIDTEKLNQVANQLRGIKVSMDEKIAEIGTVLNKLESDLAYQSEESIKIRQVFDKFKNTTQTEFDKDMDAFAAFMEKVSTHHIETAANISNNIDIKLSNPINDIQNKFNS